MSWRYGTDGDIAGLRRPIDPEYRRDIATYFKGVVVRAFRTLCPNDPVWDTDRPDVLCGQNEFYRAMRGEAINAAKAERIELKWAMLDKGTGRVAPVPKEPVALKAWIQAQFGTLRRLREQLFPDWSYPTLCSAVAGLVVADRREKLHARLTEYRDKKMAERARQYPEASKENAKKNKR